VQWGCIVAEQVEKPPRPWQEIADEVTKEKDPNRTLELMEELNAALAFQTKKKPNQPAIKAA
jgi:hypothetical protein